MSAFYVLQPAVAGNRFRKIESLSMSLHVYITIVSGCAHCTNLSPTKRVRLIGY